MLTALHALMKLRTFEQVLQVASAQHPDLHVQQRTIRFCHHDEHSDLVDLAMLPAVYETQALSWEKNPVHGSTLHLCNDIFLLKNGDTFGK